LNIRDELHALVEALDERTAKEQLHVVIDALDEEQVREAVTRMRGTGMRHILEKLGFSL
jgi:hypothetical protein